MNGFQYIGLDIHKRTIKYCLKTRTARSSKGGR
jgi:hypothetical protein